MVLLMDFQPEEPTQQSSGLINKYLVRRLDDPTGKHEDCRFFVLDPQHDPIARAVLAEYAYDTRCPQELSIDILRWAREVSP